MRPPQRDLCKTLGFPPLAGEMSEGQRGIAERQTPTIPVHTSSAKDPQRSRPLTKTKGPNGELIPINPQSRVTHLRQNLV